METYEQEKQRQRCKRQPGPRPPRTFREHFFHTLPDYSGPYSVGTMDIEVPVREPRTFSRIKRNHAHVLRMNTVLFSIYYPCDVSSYSTKAKKPSRATWLPRPRVPTCHGYAKFWSAPHLPVTAYIAATTMFTKLPAFRNAKLSGARPSAELDAAVPAGSQDTMTPGRQKSVFPVILFSHGLGGSRTCYSAICGEMASNGFIVVAIEHRDGSGARSYVNLPPNETSPEADRPGVTDENRSYKVDYIFPEDNAKDTSPHNARGVDVELRNAQIDMRMAEIEEIYYVLQLIDDGHGEIVYEANLRRKGNVGSGSKGLEDIDWPDWEGRMFLHNVTVMGHSFGGATTVQVVRQKDHFRWIGQGIILDAWGPATPPLGEESLQKPILAINSEAFMHWTDNFQRLVDICKEARSNNAPCWMLTIKGSTHLSQSDFGVLYPRWMSLLMKTIVNPRRAVYLTVNASFEFLKKVLPPEQTLQNDWPDEGILSTKSLVTDKVPSSYKPAEKWMATRLKIPNEFWLRLKRRFGRKPKEPKVATDIGGKPLVGIVNFPPGSEVWMHCSPNSEDEDLEHPKPVTSTPGSQRRETSSVLFPC
ncbi:hypothetical protein HD806DRAFT_53558 [Xylariaceae sp. AK1471]|nr:hypothetical protein HD806DRAFT_53558 [Xylariaceae sp. AK1471]